MCTWSIRRTNHNTLVKLKRTFYDASRKDDTIYAPLTVVNPHKGSPLSVLRISGSRTVGTVELLTNNRLLRRKDASNFSQSRRSIKPRQATIATICDPYSKQSVDIGLVLWFPEPNSYTGEDVCELHLHGSQAIVSKMMNVLGQTPGLRPADPGEFTRRAVMNGKMTLVQAEGLGDLISSQTEIQRRMALRGLDGSTMQKYEKWKDVIVKILAHLEASIDFGEDELIGEQRVVKECTQQIEELASDMHKFMQVGRKRREFMQGGARVVILGRPNAGKSTFMNLLCGKDKSIVSDLSGTTRDVVEHSLELAGHRVSLYDTAGLSDNVEQQAAKDARDDALSMHASIEREGIKRALAAANSANIIVYLIDATCAVQNLQHLQHELASITQIARDAMCGGHTLRHVHIVINKIDLLASDQRDKLSSAIAEVDIKETLASLTDDDNTQLSLVSCNTRERLDQFMTALSTAVERLSDASKTSEIDLDYVNERHLAILAKAHMHLERAARLDISNIDTMAQHVRASVDLVSSVIGSVDNEQVLDIIFRDFCIGK